jgi:hypothetical protein
VPRLAAQKTRGWRFAGRVTTWAPGVDVAGMVGVGPGVAKSAGARGGKAIKMKKVKPKVVGARGVTGVRKKKRKAKGRAAV